MSYFYPRGIDDFVDNPLAEDSAKQWWRHIRRIPLLTAEEEVSLAKRIEQGDSQAFDKMVESNLRLVGSIARKYLRFAGSSLTLADLIQEGNLGLILAVNKFDWRKDCKFSTSATYWIRQAIVRSIDNKAHSIRLPVHIVESIGRVNKVNAILFQELGRRPTILELSMEMGMTEEQMRELVEHGDPVSLDLVIGDGEDCTLVDFVEDEESTSPEDGGTHFLLRVELDRAFTDVLTEREGEVLRLRYGLTGMHPKTLEEVAKLFKLTRERIRQIEKSALKKLRFQFEGDQNNGGSPPKRRLRRCPSGKKYGESVAEFIAGIENPYPMIRSLELTTIISSQFQVKTVTAKSYLSTALSWLGYPSKGRRGLIDLALVKELFEKHV